MKRVLLTIAYDGTDYHGWQFQPNGITVQECMQNALEKLLGERPSLTGCSRTDAGVHARQFCCHLDCEDAFPENAFLKGLNSILPDDIAVVGYKEVANDFHARYDAKGKNYIYRFYESGITDPFLSRYALRVERKLNIERMNEFCKSLVGTHDFLPFSSSGRSVTDTVRTVTECSMITDGGLPALSVSANGFLYNMVRIIAGTLIQVGNGTIRPEEMPAILEACDRNAAGPTAPAHGLTMIGIQYEEK